MKSATFKLCTDNVDLNKSMFPCNKEIILAIHLPYENFFDMVKKSPYNPDLDLSQYYFEISDFYHFDSDQELNLLVNETIKLISLEHFLDFKTYKEFYFYLESFMKEKGYDI